MVKKEKSENKFKQFFGSRWFGIAVGLIGICLALFFGLRSQPACELVYAVNPVRTAVVTAGQASELEVFHEGESLGNVNITAAQVAVWNAGKQSIRQENVLEPVVLYSDPPVPILEASIRQYSREVTKFTLDATPELLASGVVPVSWYILEENDGASIQLIYEGTQDVNFHVGGVIEGLAEIRDVELGVSVKTPQEQISEQQDTRWVFFGMGCFFGLAFLFNIYTAVRGRRSWRDFVEMAFYLALLVSSIWAFFSFSPSLWPPFGF